MKHAHVLIVDDDPALLQALSDALQLRLRGLDVETADSAHAALERIAASEYDAIVADIKMPGMDGLELLARIRELSPDVPTLLITGHGEHDLAIQALRGGAHDYVQKPIDRDYFVGSLGHAIERHRLGRKVAQQKRVLERHARALEECLEDRTHELRELYQREALARAELERAGAELETARQRRDELVSMIAHDLATPLTTLRGYAEILARPNVAPAVRDRAKSVIVSETGRMARLVQDLVADAEPTTVRFSIQPAPCDVAGLAREQVDIAGARSKRHTIVLDAPARLELTCDGARVAQVLANLLANAITHTPPGEIRVVVRRQGRQARLSVHDQGPGIPPDRLETIFEPGVRLQGRRAGQHPTSSGLGLSIARDIVQAHGGRIWAESRPAEGTAFHLLLPIIGAARPRPPVSRPKRPRTPRRGADSRIPVG